MPLDLNGVVPVACVMDAADDDRAIGIVGVRRENHDLALVWSNPYVIIPGAAIDAQAPLASGPLLLVGLRMVDGQRVVPRAARQAHLAAWSARQNVVTGSA